MRYRRMRIEVESPEQLGYAAIRHNLAESSVSDMCLADYGIDADVGRIVLPYGDHLGLKRLRELVAAKGPGLSADDVLLTAGASSALFIVATSLLHEGTHALVCSPNYATNLETPRAIAADLESFALAFEDAWRLDLDALASRLRPETRLVSVTYPHNPTGSMIDRKTLEQLVALVERHPSALLLVDETYRELAYGEPLPMATSISRRVIAVSSMSKSYGLPGLRSGWLTCRDPDLMETFLAAKEQMFITGSVLDEELTARVLEDGGDTFAQIKTRTETQLAIVREWVAGNGHFEWVEPAAGVVSFPRLRPELSIDVDSFYRALFEDQGTYVGPGWWFDQDPRYFRLGFAWPAEDELRGGLAGLDRAAAASQISRT